MAQTILSSKQSAVLFQLIDEAARETVAKGLAIARVGLRYSSTAMRHSKENGSTVVDSRTIQPVRVDIDVIADTLDKLQALNNVLVDQTTVYTIITKGIVLRRMMLSADTIKQTSEMISASPVKLAFEEVLVQGVATNTCEQAADSSLRDKGLQVVRQVQATAEGFARSVQTFIITGVSGASDFITGGIGNIPGAHPARATRGGPL